MLGKKIFDGLSDKLGDAITNSPIKDIENNAKAVLGSAFTRMDLVTRGEFDIQQQVLLKTREKLAALEERISMLESQLMAEQIPAEVEAIVIEVNDNNENKN